MTTQNRSLHTIKPSDHGVKVNMTLDNPRGCPIIRHALYIFDGMGMTDLRAWSLRFGGRLGGYGCGLLAPALGLGGRLGLRRLGLRGCSASAPPRRRRLRLLCGGLGGLRLCRGSRSLLSSSARLGGSLGFGWGGRS